MKKLMKILHSKRTKSLVFFSILLFAVFVSTINCLPTDDFTEDFYTKGNIYSWNGTAWRDLTTIGLPIGDIVGTTDTQTLTNKVIYSTSVGDNDFEVTAAGQYRGFSVINEYDGGNGAAFTTYTDSATPANFDLVGNYNFYGNDSGDNKQKYGQMGVVARDVTNDSENGRFSIWLVDDGSWNTAFYLESDGTMYIDGTYEIFDDFDDTSLLLNGFKNKDFKLLQDAGLADYDSIENQYMINVTGIMSLIAGMLEEKDKEIKELRADVEKLKAK